MARGLANALDFLGSREAKFEAFRQQSSSNRVDICTWVWSPYGSHDRAVAGLFVQNMVRMTSNTVQHVVVISVFVCWDVL